MTKEELLERIVLVQGTILAQELPLTADEADQFLHTVCEIIRRPSKRLFNSVEQEVEYLISEAHKIRGSNVTH